MPNPNALEYGVYYHIYNRGNNGENIFVEQHNYRYFLQLYAKYVEPVADTYAYCLLRNHFHLLVRIKTKEEIQRTFGVWCENPKLLSPSQQFSHWFNAYAKAINKSYGRTGSLFEHPFRRIPVTSDAYFTQLVVYVHHNPQKHGLVNDFREWPYSSYHTLLSTKATRLKRDDVLTWFDGTQGMVKSHLQGIMREPTVSLLLEDFE